MPKKMPFSGNVYIDQHNPPPWYRGPVNVAAPDSGGNRAARRQAARVKQPRPQR